VGLDDAVIKHHEHGEIEAQARQGIQFLGSGNHDVELVFPAISASQFRMEPVNPLP
jgi:hypothetical protein